MDAQPTPRATAPYLESYVGRNVTVVGKVAQLRGDQAVIDADGSITAHLNRVRADLSCYFLLLRNGCVMPSVRLLCCAFCPASSRAVVVHEPLPPSAGRHVGGEDGVPRLISLCVSPTGSPSLTR